MKNFSHAFEESEGKINAAILLKNVRTELNGLEDYFSERAGWQMHRAAVVGKKLRAIVHGRNIYNETSTPWRVAVRVDGQYTDYATVYLYTRPDAESLKNEFDQLSAIGLEA